MSGLNVAAAPPPVVPQGSGPATVAVGADAGGGPTVTLLDAQGRAVNTFLAFDSDYTGGVRVASADFNGDGVLDTAVATGPGVSVQVRVLDGKTQAELFRLSPFESAFTGGAFLSAGDLTGDGVPDLVVSPDTGGGPRVRVFSGAGFAQVADFYGIDDPAFRGGARTAVGDLDGDGVGDLIVAAGTGGGPRVAGYSGQSVTANAPTKMFADFFAFEQALRDGVYLTAVDVNRDGRAEIVTGAGPGGGPRVVAWDGRALVATNSLTRDADFFAGDEANRGGVRVGPSDLNGDGQPDLVTGTGRGGSAVGGYQAISTTAGTPDADFEYTIFPEFKGGVFVG